MRPLWQPRMVIDGKPIQGVLFDAWKTDWPRDGSDLSNKTIEVYLPSKPKISLLLSLLAPDQCSGRKS